MKNIEEVIQWYGKNASLYKSLAQKVEEILRDNIKQNEIQVHSINSRGKDLNSYKNKAAQEKYQNPIEEIKDLAGIRVITYLESEVRKISDIVESLFTIIPDDSMDQSKLLGSDRVGYRSVHYVAKFDRNRCRLPEYKVYEKLLFEIQIRSLLQHAWAEVEHDRNYKFSGKLPSKLERRFYLVAGMLEIADNEFTTIAEEIEKYRIDISEELKTGELDIEINTISLKDYLFNKFKGMVKAELVVPHFGKDDSISKDVVEELRLFGIAKLSELDSIIPKDYEDKVSDIPEYWNNFAGLTRDFLIINDAKRYFEVCWKKRWTSIEPNEIEVYENYEVDINYIKEYVNIEPFNIPNE